MPLFVKLNKDYAAQDLAVVTVSLDDEKTMRHLPNFVKKQKMKDLQIWLGGNIEQMEKLGTQGALPTTILRPLLINV